MGEQMPPKRGRVCQLLAVLQHTQSVEGDARRWTVPCSCPQHYVNNGVSEPGESELSRMESKCMKLVSVILSELSECSEPSGWSLGRNMARVSWQYSMEQNILCHRLNEIVQKWFSDALVRAQHADTAPGAVDNDASISVPSLQPSDRTKPGQAGPARAAYGSSGPGLSVVKAKAESWAGGFTSITGSHSLLNAPVNQVFTQHSVPQPAPFDSWPQTTSENPLGKRPRDSSTEVQGPDDKRQANKPRP
ncbi:predicted protein [Postia placenta Mad-698-R]|nr:predicted protein [Postia placenta Mad-698-R]